MPLAPDTGGGVGGSRLRVNFYDSMERVKKITASRSVDF